MLSVDRRVARYARPLFVLGLALTSIAGDDTTRTDAPREELSSTAGTAIQKSASRSTARAPEFELEDQFGATHQYAYPREKIAVLLIADKEGSKQVSSWVVPLHGRYKDQIDIDGVADLSAVPALLRGTVRFFIKRGADHPIMLDWDGAVTRGFACTAGKVNVFLVSKDGVIGLTLHGPADDSLLEQLYEEIDRLRGAGAAS